MCNIKTKNLFEEEELFFPFWICENRGPKCNPNQISDVELQALWVETMGPLRQWQLAVLPRSPRTHTVGYQPRKRTRKD